MRSQNWRSLPLLIQTFLFVVSCGIPHCAIAASAPKRLAFDFNDGPTWKAAKAYAGSHAIKTSLAWQQVGSYDVAGSSVQSGGWRLSLDSPLDAKSLRGGFVSGPLAVATGETNLGKLTLSFTLSASVARPVTVKVASYNAAGRRTGGLETRIYPAAPDFLQRYALDLNTFQPSGVGRFSPTDPTVQFAFELGEEWPVGYNEIRVDNVNYSGPAYYVSPTGKDTSDGKTEKTAFATPQKALDVAGPGAIVLLMEGTYKTELAPVASFPRAGAPADWIVLKNYPGQTPTLSSNGWNIVSIAQGSKEKPYDGPALAYLEIRGLHVRGEGDVAKTKYADAMNKADSRTNSNGIAADGRSMKNGIHHLRFADNLVEYCPGQGLGALESDWVTIENNVSRYNCWTTIYATSGISTLGATNFDAADNIYKMLIRNNICYRNETYEIWQQVGHNSDGNGIIIDVNQKTSDRPNSSFRGRTLVQSNLCVANGGSGIHTVSANRVDIINNTAYMNSASKKLEYSQIFAYGSEDVRIYNNILVAPVADVAAGEKPEPVNKISGPSKNVIYSHNIYSGGNIEPVMGDGDQVVSPQFINPSTDLKVADFHVKAGSPANGAARVEAFSPFTNLDGKTRGTKPNIGVF